MDKKPSFCTKCGSPLYEDSAFCVKCGAPVPAFYNGNAPVAGQPASSSGNGNQDLSGRPDLSPMQPAQTPQRSSKGLIIGLIAVCVLLIGAVAAVLFLRRGAGKNNDDPQTSTIAENSTGQNGQPENVSGADSTAQGQQANGAENAQQPDPADSSAAADPMLTQMITTEEHGVRIQYYDETGLETGLAFLADEAAMKADYIITFDENNLPVSMIFPTGDEQQREDGTVCYPGFKINIRNTLSGNTVTEAELSTEGYEIPAAGTMSVLDISVVNSIFEKFSGYTGYRNARVSLKNTEYYFQNENGILRERRIPLEQDFYDENGNPSRTVTYDLNGTVVAELLYNYDADGKIVSVGNRTQMIDFQETVLEDGTVSRKAAPGTGAEAEFLYDSQGNLIKSTFGATVTTYHSPGLPAAREVWADGRKVMDIKYSYDHENDLDLSQARPLPQDSYVWDEEGTGENSAQAGGTSAANGGSTPAGNAPVNTAVNPSDYNGSWDAFSTSGAQEISLEFSCDQKSRDAHCNFRVVRLMNIEFDVTFDENGIGTIGTNDFNITGTMELSDDCIILHLDDDHPIYFDSTVSEFIGASEIWLYRS